MILNVEERKRDLDTNYTIGRGDDSLGGGDGGKVCRKS